MAKFLPLVLAKRFCSSVREEGLGIAVRRAGRYLARRYLGRGFGSIDPTLTGKQPRSDQYLHGIWRVLAQEDAFHIQSAPSVNRGRRLIAMVADLNLPQCRKYRVEQLAMFWRARGVEFEYAHYEDIPRAVRIMQHATHLMEYRLQTGSASEMIRYEARRLRLPILYDIDDPLFSISAYETYRNMDVLDPQEKAHFLTAAPKYLSMMNGADVLSVSTPGMAAHAELYTERPVYLRRNFADEQTLRAGTVAMANGGPEDGAFRVAFASGSKGHEIDLAEIIDPLAEFVAADPSRQLLLIGHFDVAHLPKGLERQVRVAKFTGYDHYLATLRTANCTVMPLCDDAFNRCKSAVRVLDSAAVGVPAIVGPIGDLPMVVSHEQSGFVANTQSDWIAALRDLAADPQAGAQLGLAARKELEKSWQASDKPHIIAPELIDWVEA